LPQAFVASSFAERSKMDMRAQLGETVPESILPNVLVLGPFQATKIKTIVCPGIRQYADHIQAATDKLWQELLTKKMNLFDGPVWGIVSYAMSEDNELHLEVQESSYRFQMYTHFTEAGRALPAQEVGEV
jgi:hypothetical protein